MEEYLRSQSLIEKKTPKCFQLMDESISEMMTISENRYLQQQHSNLFGLFFTKIKICNKIAETQIDLQVNF